MLEYLLLFVSSFMIVYNELFLTFNLKFPESLDGYIQNFDKNNHQNLC